MLTHQLRELAVHGLKRHEKHAPRDVCNTRATVAQRRRQCCQVRQPLVGQHARAAVQTRDTSALWNIQVIVWSLTHVAASKNVWTHHHQTVYQVVHSYMSGELCKRHIVRWQSTANGPFKKRSLPTLCCIWARENWVYDEQHTMERAQELFCVCSCGMYVWISGQSVW